MSDPAPAHSESPSPRLHVVPTPPRKPQPHEDSRVGGSFIQSTLSAAFVSLAGVWLAVLQIVLFLSLQLLLSSAFVTYVVVVACWLAGAAIGVWIPRGPWSFALMVLSGLTPYASLALLAAAPYDTSLVLVHGGFVLVTALYAGQLFQQERQSFARVATLFFYENTGFVLGLVLGVVGFVLLGRGFLQAAPAVGLVTVALVAALRRAAAS